jgi:hypothetical protein
MPELKVPYQYVADLTRRAAEQIQRDFAEITDAMNRWTAYTPGTQGLTLGNGLVGGRWTRHGNLVVCRIALLGGTTTTSTARIGLQLPVTASTADVNAAGADFISGSGRLLNGGAYEYMTVARNSDTDPYNYVMFMSPVDASGSGVVGDAAGTLPFTFGNGDRLQAVITYEAA